MSVFRVEKNNNYTTMSNYHLRDTNLSLKAIGLLSKILSLPEDWDYSITGLVSICKEQRSAVEAALKELKAGGYLFVEKLMPNKTDSGRIEYIYHIYEQPRSEKQEAEKQGVENQCIENQLQLNTDKLNTEKQNNNNVLQGKKKSKVNEEALAAAIVIIDHLNQRTGKHYLYGTKETVKQISNRLRDGFVVADFIRVIDVKSDEWLGTKMEQYLRPTTLFGPKFEGYLNQQQARRELTNEEIARMLDEAERRSYDERTMRSDAGEGCGRIPEHL